MLHGHCQTHLEFREWLTFLQSRVWWTAAFLDTSCRIDRVIERIWVSWMGFEVLSFSPWWQRQDQLLLSGTFAVELSIYYGIPLLYCIWIRIRGRINTREYSTREIIKTRGPLIAQVYDHDMVVMVTFSYPVFTSEVRMVVVEINQLNSLHLGIDCTHGFALCILYTPVTQIFLLVRRGCRGPKSLIRRTNLFSHNISSHTLFESHLVRATPS